jgi:LemA protein
MSTTQLVVAGLLLVAAIYVVLVYNGLVQVRHAVRAAWSNIDVLLKQRHDELPNLVEVCRGYVKHEQQTLARLTALRSGVLAAGRASDAPALGRAEGALRGALDSVFALAESYPALKADALFQQLQTRISGLENAIADRREFYNESVTAYNIRTEQFPEVLIAGPLGFRHAELLEFDAGDNAAVDVGGLLRSARA